MPVPAGHIGDRRDLERVAAPVAQQRLAQDRVPDLAISSTSSISEYFIR